MGKIITCSMGTGTRSTILTTINRISGGGRTSVGINAPAR